MPELSLQNSTFIVKWAPSFAEGLDWPLYMYSYLLMISYLLNYFCNGTCILQSRRVCYCSFNFNNTQTLLNQWARFSLLSIILVGFSENRNGFKRLMTSVGCDYTSRWMDCSFLRSINDRRLVCYRGIQIAIQHEVPFILLASYNSLSLFFIITENKSPENKTQ